MESLVSLPTFTHSFQGNPLITVTWQGRPAWIARHIGARLGYHDEGKRFPNTILGEWKDEFIEGKDYVVLAGEDLAAFKELPGAEGVSPHAHNSLLLLFESGLHLALIKTRKKLGQDLRRFLAEEVMPQLVRTGAYQPEGTRSPTLVLVTLAPPPPRPTGARGAAGPAGDHPGALGRLLRPAAPGPDPAPDDRPAGGGPPADP